MYRQRARHRHCEVGTVELVTVGDHRDQVTAIGQVQSAKGGTVKIILVPLGVDRAVAAILDPAETQLQEPG